MRDRAAWAPAAVAAILLVAGCSASGSSEAAPFSCELTRPPADADHLYGEVPLQVFLPDGGYRSLDDDGGHRIKLAWSRHIEGDLEISARRLDGPGTAIAEMHEDSYPDIGVLPTSIVLSDHGCWEVTATLGEAATTVVLELLARAGAAPPLS